MSVMTTGLLGRLALLVSLALAWLNLLSTGRWAAVPGALNGPRYPFYLAILICVSLLAWRARPARVRLHAAAAVACAGGLGWLLYAFFIWFPTSTWSQIPFLDDWPPRFQSTVTGARLLREGLFTGWQWSFLGGYPVSTDVTQDLSLWAALPMWLFGAETGFHATHLLLFLAVPLLVWLDMRVARERTDVRRLATGLAALFATSYSYVLIRSGDTNSLAGAVSALASLTAAHAARAGFRGGPLALVIALTVANNSHRGFFVYALMFLALDALLARDWRSGARAAIAATAALIVSLPRTWDLWWYPSYYIVNNVELTPAPFAWGGLLRKVFYNVELLWQPGRWLNDSSGLALVCAPIVAFVAWKGPRRIRFYAFATLGVLAMVRLNHSMFGYAFIRPLHMLPIFLAPPLAWFVLRCAGRRVLSVALVAWLALFIQVWLVAVPHVRDVGEFGQELVRRVAASRGHLVLLENAFHRDVDVEPSRDSLPTPFGVHYEALLPEATGRRLYAGMWDGWQWTPYRDQVLANGTFRGHALSEVPVPELISELRRWGVRDLFVWSDPARRYLSAAGGFRSVWSSARWEQFEFDAADVREVVTGQGNGTLEARGPFGGVVRLTGARQGDHVVARMNYHPAWQGSVNGEAVPLVESGGQLAFTAPADGEVVMTLEYPRPKWLLLVAAAAGVAGVWLVGLVRVREG